jgi:hypothetical protein
MCNLLKYFFFTFYKTANFVFLENQAWWHILMDPEFARLRQKDQEFQISLGYLGRLYLKNISTQKNKKTKQNKINLKRLKVHNIKNYHLSRCSDLSELLSGSHYPICLMVSLDN